MKLCGFFLILLFVVSCTQSEKTTGQPESSAPVEIIQTSDLPPLLFTTTTGQEINAKKLTGKTIIILFQPDCDHCQREAVHIQENLNAFRYYSIYFVSADLPEKIKDFAAEYKLMGAGNIAFGRAEGDQIYKSYGGVAAPSIYIYNENGKLVKDFHGETDISLILASL